MIPYIHFPSYKLGPFTLEIFGVFVAIGIYIAARINYAQAKREGLDPQPMADFAFYSVVAGVVSGHLVHLLLYHPEEMSRSPWQLFKFWDGLSSFGGLLGGIVTAMIFFRMKKVPFDTYADALAVGMAPGWAIARIGCFLVHDHPGVKTDFPLAVNFPAQYFGGPRHDLGLYDSLWLFTIAGVLWWMRKNGILRHRLMAVMAVLYAPARFLFDFLRASDLAYVDKRYLGLTPAQYGCMIILVYGVVKLARSKEPVRGPIPIQPPSGSKSRPQRQS